MRGAQAAPATLAGEADVRQIERKFGMRYFVLGILFLAACSASGGSLSEELRGAPASWAILDADSLNVSIEEAIAAGDSWPRSPILVTLYLVGGDDDIRSLVLEEVKNRAEGADLTKVVCIRDGLLDDSVRGDWHEFNLNRLADSTWRVSDARASYRCWRSDNTDEYQESPCP